MENQKIYGAFVRAQAAFAPALKTSTNPHFKSKYADLSACIEAVIDALHAQGIGLVQRTHQDDRGVTVETCFLHESGESFTGGTLHVPASKQDPQGYGSALSYARRYSLMAACGIAPEDDDGNAASKPRTKAPVIGARDGIGEDLPQEWKDYLRDLAQTVSQHVADGNAKSALAAIREANLDEVQYTYLFNHLDAKTRAAIKKEPA